MKTFILEWKPSISSYKLQDFENDLEYIEYGEFNWSVWDWEKARSGDNFYMIKCSEGKTGIVMKGFFTSEPYEADDWSGKDRKVHYMDFRPTFMIHPDKCPMLTTAVLEKALPDFQWNGGHSGRLLQPEYVPVLDSLWNGYVSSLNDEVFDQVRADRCLIPEAGIDDAVSLASDAFYEKKDSDGRPLILRALELGLSGKTEQEMICGFLNNVLTDGELSAGRLRERGFSEEIVDILLQQ